MALYFPLQTDPLDITLWRKQRLTNEIVMEHLDVPTILTLDGTHIFPRFLHLRVILDPGIPDVRFTMGVLPSSVKHVVVSHARTQIVDIRDASPEGLRTFRFHEFITGGA